jgi:hypothetical protein
MSWVLYACLAAAAWALAEVLGKFTLGLAGYEQFMLQHCQQTPSVVVNARTKLLPHRWHQYVILCTATVVQLNTAYHRRLLNCCWRYCHLHSTVGLSIGVEFFQAIQKWIISGDHCGMTNCHKKVLVLSHWILSVTAPAIP